MRHHALKQEYTNEDERYRVYMLTGGIIHVIDVNGYKEARQCMDACNENVAPYMVYRFMGERWVKTAHHNLRKEIEDGLGRLPLQYAENWRSEG